MSVGQDAFDLPLFPLQTVLFPGGPLVLRVFEPRYLDMVARCLRGDNRFGVVAIKQGSEVGPAAIFDVGTTAEIVDWNREPNGLLGVTAVGRRSFRLQSSVRLSDGLYSGRAVWLPRADPVPLPERFAALGKLLRSLAGDEAREALEEDAESVGFRLAEALPLAVSVKQSLLEVPDSLERLEKLSALLENFRGAE